MTDPPDMPRQRLSERILGWLAEYEASREQEWRASSVCQELERDLALTRKREIGYQRTVADQRARIAALEAERDAALKALDENWVTHQEIIAARARIAELEASLLRCDHGRDDRIMQDEKRRLRIAALEAERDRLAVAGNALVASLSDVLVWHRDPESSDYNECERTPCNFCEFAGRGLDNWRAATGEQEP